MDSNARHKELRLLDNCWRQYSPWTATIVEDCLGPSLLNISSTVAATAEGYSQIVCTAQLRLFPYLKRLLLSFAWLRKSWYSVDPPYGERYQGRWKDSKEEREGTIIARDRVQAAAASALHLQDAAVDATHPDP